MTMKPMTRVFMPAFAFLAGLAFSAPAVADQVVYFVNGKAITVKKVEKGDKITILEMDGGGKIGIPNEQIQRVEELQISAPETVVPTPPPVVPAGTVGGQPQPNAVAPAAAAPATTAPPGAVHAAVPGAPPGPGGPAAQAAGGLSGMRPLGMAGGDDDAHSNANALGPSGNNVRGPNAGRSAMMGLGPGSGPQRRFNARGGGFGRQRPVDNFVPPQSPSDATKPAAPAATTTPAAAQGKPQAPAPSTTVAPPPAPAPEPPAPEPPPETADPDPGNGDTDAPAEPPADDPPANDGRPES
jgi:hypothetical protein